ncbi:sigma-70 family RNA polymerase sigma factor [Mesorhizobium sp. CAU 1741]|uniref:sigma-70 family RNA polymerase sigma factor n=1 Tax=Mesorhizobium sp. CAU 1741 TaxID=3140366 RepID=UPI00325AA5AF
MAQFDEETLAGLMRRANGGEAPAYAAFLRAALPMLRQIARRELERAGGRGDDPEDIVQEAMLAMHLKRHTWREDEPIGPWIRAITRYKAIDYMRRRGRTAERVDIDAVAEHLAAPGNEDPTLRTDLERSVERLEGKSGAIVKAVGLEGEDISAVARRMAMSDGAVRVALHRGLRRLAALRVREGN